MTSKPSKDYLMNLLKDVLDEKKAAVQEAFELLMEHGYIEKNKPLTWLGEPDDNALRLQRGTKDS